MYVTFDSGIPRLADIDNFRALKIVIEIGETPTLESVGRVEGDHVWLNRNWLEAHGRPDDPAWANGFAGMIAYAGKSGWVDEGGAIRAHVEVTSV